MVKEDLDGAGPNGKSPRGHELEGPANGDRYHRHTRIDRQIEAALLERKKLSISTARAFRRQEKRSAFPSDLRGPAHALDSAFSVTSIYGDEATHLHGSGQHGKREKLFLPEGTDLTREDEEYRGNIQIARVIHHIDEMLIHGELVLADDVQPDASEKEPQSNPESAQAVEPIARARQSGDWYRHQTRQDCVEGQDDEKDE